MPELMPIVRLQKLSMLCLSDVVAHAISSVVDGTYEEYKLSGKNKRNSKSKDGRNAQKFHGHVLIVPTNELQKIKIYLGKSVPAFRRGDLFHRVILQVTDNLVGENSERETGVEVIAAKRLSQLEDGLRFAFMALFDPEVSRLDMTSVLHKAMKWVDICRYNATNSNECNIGYGQIENIFLKVFAENAIGMGSLTSLTWPHLISGNLLRVIGRHLKKLKALILACSCETGPFLEEERKGKGSISEGYEVDLILAIESLFRRCPGDFTGSSVPGCPHLMTLIMPNLDDEDGRAISLFADALIYLAHLEVVTGLGILGSLSLMSRKSTAPSTLALKHLSDYDPFKKRLLPEVDFLKDKLPKLESIDIKVSKDLTKRVVSLFPDITSITIEYTDFHVLAKNYASLVTLEIALDFQIPWNLLLVLSRYCRGLRHLTLEHPTFEMESEAASESRPPLMTNLEYFKLVRSSFIEFAAFKRFIMGCPNLRELYVTLTNDRNYAVDEFDDKLIKSVAPMMVNLEIFITECLYKQNLSLHDNCTLTMASAHTLISSCPRLKLLGHMDSWNVKEREVKEIQNLIRKKNWDLDLA